MSDTATSSAASSKILMDKTIEVARVSLVSRGLYSRTGSRHRGNRYCCLGRCAKRGI